LAIPITGGNFSGPRLSGTIINLGADWALIDPTTKTFYPDTRYGFVTNDGANIFVRSQGALVNDTLHLRFEYTSGNAKYSWLNDIITVGLGTRVGGGNLLKIDTWYF